MGCFFGTDGVRGLANRGHIRPEVALKLGRAVARYFKNEESEVRSSIVIGRDPRLSGSMIEASLVAGICSAGVDVRLLGVVPTPAVALLTIRSGAVAGLVVSASHNPFFDNGIKVFKGDGFKLSDEEESELEGLLEEDGFESPTHDAVGTVFRMENALEQYEAFCLERGDRARLQGMRLVLDCSNGAVSSCAGSIFRALGAEVTVLFDEPDGININEGCGSQHTESLRAQVKAIGADAGLAFDGDGDRLIAVDELGHELSGDQIMAICAKHMQKEGALQHGLVVATVMSNVGFHAALKGLGIRTLTAGVGDRQVVEMMRREQAVLGGEESGHMIFLDGHTTGDGIYSAIRLMEAVRGARLSELSRVMTAFPQRMINVDVKEKPPVESVGALQVAIAAAEAELGDEGRILIRYSGTQPMCRVMVEGPSEAVTETICERLAAVVKECLG
jgi:phosphoglucosamine mutase